MLQLNVICDLFVDKKKPIFFEREVTVVSTEEEQDDEASTYSFPFRRNSSERLCDEGIETESFEEAEPREPFKKKRVKWAGEVEVHEFNEAEEQIEGLRKSFEREFRLI